MSSYSDTLGHLIDTDLLLRISAGCGEQGSAHFWIAKGRQSVWRNGRVDYGDRFENDRVATSGPGGSNPSFSAQGDDVSTEKI